MTQLLLAALLIGLAIFVPVWKICAKAGLPTSLSLIVFIPGLGLVAMMLILAFADWAPGRLREEDTS